MPITLLLQDFCAAKRPSELLARVKARVAEKKERERAKADIDSKKQQIEDMKLREADLQLLVGNDMRQDGGPKRPDLLANGVLITSERMRLEKEVEEYEKHEAEAESARQVAKAARQKAANLAKAKREQEERERSRQGSSKDLITAAPVNDPFAATAPRAVSPSTQSAKGKGKAPAPPGKVNGPCPASRRASI